jgi:hypothetical protein
MRVKYFHFSSMIFRMNQKSNNSYGIGKRMDRLILTMDRFISFNGGMDMLLYSFHRYQFKHKSIIPAIISVMYNFSKDHMRNFFDVQVKERLNNNPTQYMEFVNTFLVC